MAHDKARVKARVGNFRYRNHNLWAPFNLSLLVELWWW